MYGSCNALYRLGQKYINGMGVERDYKKAFNYFFKSANNGYSNATCMVGSCYSNGVVYLSDKYQGFKNFEKPSNLGDMIAQYNLAKAYENGEGTNKNIVKALNWYRKPMESVTEKDIKSKSCLLMFLQLCKNDILFVNYQLRIREVSGELNIINRIKNFNKYF